MDHLGQRVSCVRDYDSSKKRHSGRQGAGSRNRPRKRHDTQG